MIGRATPGVDRGFDLTFAEARALTALIKLLAETKEKGNEPKEKIFYRN